MRILSRFIRFPRSEDGTVTAEFVILFPAFLALFLASFESGLMMIRNVMLERGVDMAVRELRLGTAVPPTFDEFKQEVCDHMDMVTKDCANVVQVQLEPVDMTTWGPLNGTPRCIDVESTMDPIDATNYTIGQNNELMLVRVCALFDPIFPTTRMGVMTAYNNRNDYALVATTAFVNEPSR